MKEKNNITMVRCDFCGTTKNSFLTYKIPSGKNIYICKHCVDDIGSNSDACKTLIKNSDADIAIKALEQESILHKIKDDIEGKYRVILKSTPKDDWAIRWNDCLDEVLEIIDKYKYKESEDKE